MPTLITLRGNSGSGKTTVARALQEKLGPNTMLISHDMVRMQILHVWSRMGVEKSLPLMLELTKYGHAHSDFTIIEGILPSCDYRPLFQAALELFGAQNIHSYFYDLPFEETLRRHATKQGTNFGEEDMRRWWQGKDLLGIIPETILTQDVGFNDAVEMIYRQAANK